MSVVLLLCCFAACKDVDSKDGSVGQSTIDSINSELNSSEVEIMSSNTKSDFSSVVSNTSSETETPSSSKFVSSAAASDKKEASVSESPLSNTLKLLQNEKKLTIGYIGGSITFGSSANAVVEGGKVTDKNGGNIMDSWVNRVSSFFKAQYPSAIVETVNAGLSDTATNFGLYRLSANLMNNEGHDMPDLVFVEFTTNDWTYSTQSQQDLETQAESLFRAIWNYNPYAEIVVVLTAVNPNGASKQAYKTVCEHYSVPFIDVGIELQKSKEARGAGSESDGTYYYTIDNLHPSSAGYGVYFETIEPVLKSHISVTLKSKNLYNYATKAPAPRKNNLITKPMIIGTDKIKTAGKAQVLNGKLFGNMYGTKLISESVPIVSSYVNITGNAQVAAQFYGTSFGLLFGMTKEGFNIRYQIDGGEWKTFAVNQDNLGWQMYDHAQVFMLEHNLSNDVHKVVITFVPNGENAVNVRLGGVLGNGK